MEEVRGDTGRRFRKQSGEGEFGRAVDRDEQIQLTFGGLHLGDVDGNSRSDKHSGSIGDIH